MRKERICLRDGLVILLAALILPLFAASCRPPLPSYDGSAYLIVTPEALLPSISDFAAYKESRGFLVDTVTLEEILAGTPGIDDPDKIRNHLMGYADSTPDREFVLLVGSMSTMPMRIAYPDPDDHVNQDVPTDFYYEELTGNWDGDGDGYYGEYGDDMSQATEDYVAELYVGRIPWDDPLEVENILDTIMLYDTDNSARMTRVIGAAATIMVPCDSAAWVNLAKGLYLDRAGYETTALYENCPSANPDLELSRDNFLGEWESQEPGLITWFSHGSSYASYGGPQGTFIDVDHLPQGVLPAVGITSGCTVGNPEVASLGRVIVREGVCAAFLGSSRSTWFGDDPVPAFVSQLKVAENFIWARKALSESKILSLEYFAQAERVPDNLPGEYFHQDLFQFMVFGDPSIQIR